MQELPLPDFDRIRPLVEASGMRGHLAFVYALPEGRMPGLVLVDNIDHPRTALVCNFSGFFFAFGRPDAKLLKPAVRDLVTSGIFDQATALYGSRPAWNRTLRAVFEPMGGQMVKRLGFAWRPSEGCPPQHAAGLLPDGFRLQPITTDVAERIEDGSGTSNYGIDPWFVRITGGPRQYAQPGLGLAVLDGENIAAVCGYCALGGGEAELEVGTVPAYSGRGLATVASAAFIEQCLAKGWHPAYSCQSGNAASIAVARKLGYKEVEEITGYHF